MLSKEKFAQLIEMGHESRSVEFRTGFDWAKPDDKWHKLRLIKSILGLSNLRDEGHVILGIDEKKDKTLDFRGCDEAAIPSFSYDAIKGEVDGYADNQAIDIEIQQAEWEGLKYLVIRVRGFEDLPTICKKDAKDPGDESKLMLRRGAVYVRSVSGEPSTVEAMEKEMRDVIEIAVDKQGSRLKRRGWSRPDAEDLDKKSFNEARGGF